MATYVLIPGAMGDPWSWHRVAPLLAGRGHEVIVVDLPAEDDGAGLDAYCDVIERAIGDRSDVVMVAHSMGALSAPIVCARRRVELLVLVAPMIPRPGETGGAWWAASGQVEAERAALRAAGRPEDGELDPEWTFLHDVPAEVAAESARHVRRQSSRPFRDPWPLAAWPAVRTRVIACTRDRLFPIDFVRRLSRERLGIEPDELECGHLPALACPEALVAMLERMRVH